MRSKVWTRCAAIVAAGALLHGNVRETRADSPMMGAAIIAAGSATIIGTAILGAGAVIAVAIILTDDSEGDGDCECPETRTEGGGDGSGGEGEEGGGSSGGSEMRVRSPSLVFPSAGASIRGSILEPAVATIGDDTTHPSVTSFIDREAELRVERAPDGYALGSVGYAFQGDIRKAPPTLRKFTHDEAMIFDVKVDTSTIRDAEACVALSFKNIRLSTQDVRGTYGSVRMRIDAHQRGVRTSSRQLRVDQGKIPQRPAWAAGPGWVFDKDRIDILEGAVALPCTPNPTGAPTELRVAVSLEFVGERQ